MRPSLSETTADILHNQASIANGAFGSYIKSSVELAEGKSNCVANVAFVCRETRGNTSRFFVAFFLGHDQSMRTTAFTGLRPVEAPKKQKTRRTQLRCNA
jgi:hypothetical protein